MIQEAKTNSRTKEVFFHNKNFTRDWSYAQAVKVGDTLYISGTVSLDNAGDLLAKGSMSEQTKVIYEDIEKILTAHNATFSDVVKEGVFTTDMNLFQAEAMSVRAKFYEGHSLPASSAWIQVERLASPDFLVEIEAIVLLQQAIHSDTSVS